MKKVSENRKSHIKGLKKLLPPSKHFLRKAHHVRRERRLDQKLLFRNRMDEADGLGMEKLAAEMELDPETPIELGVAVRGVHHHGASDLGKMLADLVLSPAFDLCLDDGTGNAEQVKMPQDMKQGLGGDQLASLPGLQLDRNLISLGNALEQGHVFFRSGRVAQDGFELGPVFGIFAEEQHSGCLGIQAMEDVGFDPLFLKLRLNHSQNGLFDRIVRIGNGYLSSGFVHRDQGLVFVKDGDVQSFGHGPIID